MQTQKGSHILRYRLRTKDTYSQTNTDRKTNFHKKNIERKTFIHKQNRKKDKYSKSNTESRSKELIKVKKSNINFYF